MYVLVCSNQKNQYDSFFFSFVIACALCGFAVKEAVTLFRHSLLWTRDQLQEIQALRSVSQLL